MGFSPPPLQPLKSEIEKRIRNGAKTLEEIDPEFYKWLQRQRRIRIYMYVALAATLIAATLIFKF